MLKFDNSRPLIEPKVIDEFRRQAVARFERAAVRSVAVVATRGRSNIRSAFAGAGLGRLGNAIGSNADEQIVRQGRDRFSVSARFFTRSRSERTLGALASYTQGSTITPQRGRYLWIPTDNIPRISKRERLTPAMWRANGLDKRIGELVLIRSVNGHPLLVIEGGGLALSGKKSSARSLTKSGRARKGQVRKELIVAFVGIPRTARAARVNLTAILEGIRAELPAILATELAKEA